MSAARQGKRHQQNLAKRAAREAADRPAQPAPNKRASLRKVVKIGRPGYRVTKQYDPETDQRSLLFQARPPPGRARLHFPRLADCWAGFWHGQAAWPQEQSARAALARQAPFPEGFCCLEFRAMWAVECVQRVSSLAWRLSRVWKHRDA